MAWEDITDILTDKGAEKLNVGEVMRFNFEGSPNELKIVRKTRRTHCTAPSCAHHNGAEHIHVFAKHVRTYTPEEVDQMVAMAENRRAAQLKAERKNKRRGK